MAADPTYPLYPIACTLAASLLLALLLARLEQRSWNLGVTFLCFWLFCENMLLGAEAIVWSDSADIKYYPAYEACIFDNKAAGIYIV